MVPLSASASLSTHLAHNYPKSAALFEHAVHRLTASFLTSASEPFDVKSITPLKESLKTALQPDTSLFATERQNLFIDSAREVRIWSFVLSALTPPPASSLISAQTVADWALGGLEELTEQMRQSKEVGRADGPLGWTSNPEVFVLGLKVLAAVSVCGGWIGKVYLGEVGGGRGFESLEIALGGFVEGGRDGALHEAWIEEAERSLRRLRETLRESKSLENC
jgi:hypothetical protein